MAAEKDGRLSTTAKIRISFVAVASLLVLYADYISAIGILNQILLGLVVLFVSGAIIKKIGSLNGGYGVYMISTSRGIGTINRIAKSHKSFWNNMALWGIVLGFGIFSYPIVKGKISKGTFAFGIFTILFILILVTPYFSYSLQFIDLPGLQARIASAQTASASSGVSPLSYLSLVITVVFGFSGFVFFSLLLNSFSILLAVFAIFQHFAANGVVTTKPLQSVIPGVAPIIPGLDIPLIAGVIALAVLLVAHEFSHGILSRIFRVRIKSIGLLLFGIIPIGAFVEPDEEKVKKLDAISQNKIFSAGISANFVLMFVFFVPMLLLLVFALPHIYVQKLIVESTIPGFPANGVIAPGAQILSWDGVNVSTLSQLEAVAVKDMPGGVVTVSTNQGDHSFIAKSENGSSRGFIGVDVGQVSSPVVNTPLKSTEYFLYTVFALSFMFNFLVAVVNLLPLPGFDGKRIYDASVKDKRITNFLAAVVIVTLLINIIPWI